MTSKQIISLSVDADIAQRLRDRNDLNVSAIGNQFFRDYLYAGMGREAALEQRINRIDEEIEECRKELTRLERERDRLESMVADQRSNIQDAIKEVADIYRKGNDEYWTASNPAIQRYAAQVDMEPKALMQRVETEVSR